MNVCVLDIDECAEQREVCHYNQQCHNTIGSYACRLATRCGHGYERNNMTGYCDGVPLLHYDCLKY